MADTVTKAVRRKIMQAVKQSGSVIERCIQKELRKKKICFVTNDKLLPGKPDIALKKKKVVVFIDSCFWHSCPKHTKIPKTNRTYWSIKIQNNKKRDKKISSLYKKMHWKILRFWGHEITKDNLPKVIKKIIQNIK